jgi:hypothetical protein
MPRYPVDTRIVASIDGQTVLLRNIGKAGIALRAAGLEAGSTHMLEINLDHQHISLGIEIVERSTDRLLHARFISENADAMDAIASYVNALAATESA